MTVIFYSGFSKQLNSTKQPGGGTSYDCILKDDCSMIHPRISLGGNFNPEGMMYCRIPAFNRYYFVSDWQWIGGAWVASLSVDAMATYKTQIGETSAYITRANTADYNQKISDGMYPATTETSVVSAFGTTQYWESTVAAGTYIVGVISGAADTVGSVTCYTMSPSQFSALKAFMFNEDFFQEVMNFPDVEEPAQLLTSISPELLKTIFNPSQYIVSAMWFPVSVSGYSSESVKLGWWETDATGGRLSAGAVKIDMPASFITMPTHPQAATRGTYLNYAPYSEYVLHFPPFGSIPLDPSFFDFHTGAPCVALTLHLDIITGKASVVVTVGDSTKRIAELHAQVGVPISISQVTPDVQGTGNAVLVRGAGAALEGMAKGAGGGVLSSLAGTIAGAKDGIMSALSQPVAQVITNGMNGSFAGITDGSPYIVAQFHHIADADDTHKGRPVCQIGTIGSYSGFVQCAEGDISISGTEEERAAIMGYMTSGFFYE